MFLQRFVALFMIEILRRVLKMDCKRPKLAFCSEIPLFYSFERWSKYLWLGNRWKIDTLAQQFCQVFEPVTWLNPAHLCNCEDSLSARHHLVPLVMQHVHVAVWLVTADEFRYVGGELWVLGHSDPVTWGGETTQSVQFIKTPSEQTECATKLH